MAKPRSARDQPMVQAECRERGCCAALALRAPVRSRALRGCSSYAEATPIDAERKREPEGQPRRARGDDEASVARSAARSAYRHHHSTQHCAAQQLKHNAVFQQMLATKKFLFEASSVCDAFPHVTLGGIGGTTAASPQAMALGH